MWTGVGRGVGKDSNQNARAAKSAIKSRGKRATLKITITSIVESAKACEREREEGAGEGDKVRSGGGGVCCHVVVS